jgi:hypothetical protein
VLEDRVADKRSARLFVEHAGHDIILKGGNLQGLIRGFLQDRGYDARIFTGGDESTCVSFSKQYKAKQMQEIAQDTREMLRATGFVVSDLSSILNGLCWPSPYAEYSVN